MQLKQPESAKEAFKKAVEVIRTCVLMELKKNGSQQPDNKVTNEELVQPSVFDNDNLKELKALLQTLLENVLETNESKQMEEQIQKMKERDEGENVKVDENFGKVQPNADQFKDVTLSVKVGKKRTHNEMIQEQNPTAKATEGDENLKRKKFEEATDNGKGQQM